VYRMLESKTKSSPVGDLIAVRYRSTGGGRGKSKGRGRGHGHANQRQLSSNSSISCCLSFTLEKRGVETLDALQQIATILEVPVASFGYAGTKDAYAVTRQSVTVNIEGQDEEVCLQRLKALVSNDALVSRGLRVEDPALRRTGGMLQLGQHAGNHFKIVLRGALEAQPQSPAAVEDAAIRQSKWTTVEAAARSLKRHGFINYFGEQRFQGGMEAVSRARSLLAPPVWRADVCMRRMCAENLVQFRQENTTDVIGLLLLKHDWVGAVTRFLGPDPAESNERTRQARALVTVGVPLEMAAVVKMLELFP
jgi:tRNA pseudouridine13 synthase